jgi:hypothetical protein
VSGIKALLKKMEGYGITGNLLHWLENYISNRYQRVIIRNCLSEKGNLKGDRLISSWGRQDDHYSWGGTCSILRNTYTKHISYRIMMYHQQTALRSFEYCLQYHLYTTEITRDLRQTLDKTIVGSINGPDNRSINT